MLFSSTILLLCSLFTWSAGGYAFLAPSALTPHTHLTAARRTTKSYNPLNSIIGEQSMRTPLVNKVTTALSSSRTDDDEDDDDSNLEPLEVLGAAVGLGACPVGLWSEFQRSCDHAASSAPLSLVEGVAFSTVAVILVWSAYTKITTGRGLKPGPGGVLGAVEGMAYVTVVGALFASGVIPDVTAFLDTCATLLPM